MADLHRFRARADISRSDRRARRPPQSPPTRPYVNERGAFGILREPAAAIVRRHGGQTRRAPTRGRMRRSAKAPRVVVCARTAPWHLDRVETSGRESLTLPLSLG